MINQNNLDFSFSGLKTAVLHTLKKEKLPITFLAYEIQEAITDCLVKKTSKAVEKLHPRSVLIAGGVAANQKLRDKLKIAAKKLKNNLFMPPKNLCTDNAASIASRAFFNFKPIPWKKIKVNPTSSLGL